LFRMLRVHSAYKNKVELLLMMGDYEEVKEKPSTAIPFYEQAMQQGSIVGYIACANIHEERGDYEQSLLVLEKGWSLYKDVQILGKLVSILCRVGKISEAREKYEELNRINKGENVPFLVYKGYIENDEELRLFEELVSEYITEGSFIPFEGLGTLAATATYYIEKSISEEDGKIKVLSNKSLEDWTSHDFDVLKRRLWLMQTDILTLGNERYLEVYFADLRKLGIGGDPYTRDILQDFFMEYFSKEVECRGEENEKSIADYTENTLFENIWLHANRIVELFSSGDSYDLIQDTITPLLVDCEKLGYFYDEEIDLNRIESLVFLKRQKDYYNTLRSDTREDYEIFLHEFDEKYGMYYRKHIQRLAATLPIIPQGYPVVLKEYPEIAFLFWMEKNLKGGMHTSDPEELEKIVMKYSLDEINISNALLFGETIQELSVEYAITFLINYPRMLQIPKALYIITECLRNIYPEIREKSIADLDEFVKDNYDSESFFGHIDAIFDAIDRNGSTEDDLRYMLLTNGNISILQRKENVESLLNFRTASELGSLEGLVQAAELYEKIEEYDEALALLEKAACLDDTQLVVRNILNCSIKAERFDIAGKYIELGIRKGYDIGNQIIAFHLGQGNTQDAFLQTISMLGNNEGIIDIPEGLINHLMDTKTSILNKEDVCSGDIELKIFASYIEARLIFSNQSTLNPVNFLKHWEYIATLPDFYTGEALYEQTRFSLEPIIRGIIDMDDGSPFSLSDMSVSLLEVHAQGTYKTFKELLKHAVETNNTSKQEELFIIMNKFCILQISLLQKFPKSEEFLMGWRDNLHFHLFDYTSNNMPHTIQ
ncbi:MAG: hypothetical protein PHQ95_04140, partial [Candidatus Gracilibacteria bacterium]|nr:hypothetical protein [Candidatus Gracilibacteria bacterium]